jgi:hypothetical protein
VSFHWTSWGGWSWGHAGSFCRPWWGPVGWNARWGGDWWRAGWHSGWGGRYESVHDNHINFNNFNVYNRWGNNVHLNNERFNEINQNRITNINTRNVDRTVNNVYAGHDGNVYRRWNGNWETHANEGWRQYRQDLLSPERRTEFDNTTRSLNRDYWARQAGEWNYNHFRNTGGWGGYGGYRGYSGGWGGYRGFGGGFPSGGFRRR